MQANLYLDIENKAFESLKPRMEQASIDSDPDDSARKEYLLLDKIRIQIDDMEIKEDRDVLRVCGGMYLYNKSIGFADIEIELSQEIAINVIEIYLKKLNKLKTILQATK